MNTKHQCPLPICTKCELESAAEIQRNREQKRKLFAAYGHDINDMEDDWNEL